MQRSNRFWSVLVVALLAVTESARSDDWPAYRHDAARSASTREELALPLSCRWTWKEDLPPAPAWEPPARQDYFHKQFGLYRVDEFDLVSHPIIADGRVYVASSSTDTLTCLDGQSGRRLWNFTAEGPIRVPPVYRDGRLYCGADDGWLCCLDAASGKPRWRSFLGLADRRLPGNSRMISRWPIRGGLVLDRDRLYCSAGIFPGEGVFLCAVDAKDGHVCWRQELSTSPHGPMIASPTQLFAPTLRGPTLSFDLESGRFLKDVGPGGSCAGMYDGKLVIGVQERGGIAGLDPKIVAALGSATSLQFAQTGDGGIAAASDRKLLAADRAKCVQWTADLPDTHALIVAGNIAFVGGKGFVAARQTRDGREVWRAAAPGTVRSLAAGNHMLLAAGDDGAMHCFAHEVDVAAREQPPAVPPARSAVSAASDDLAAQVLRTSGANKGYCLVLDAQDCDLPRALARQSDLNILALQHQQAALDRGREVLRGDRLYGSRVALHRWPEMGDSQSGAPRMFPYPDWVFNLIVVCVRGDSPPIAAAEAYRMLRPGGGALVILADSKSDRKSLASWGAAIDDWTAEPQRGPFAFVARRGSLRGAGEWTHQYASPGNTACSDDALTGGPAELQWFGPPGPQSMIDRHNRASAPLFHRGQLFIMGEERITSADAYNGTILWQAAVPRSLRLAVSNDCGCMAAGDRTIFVAAGEQCVAFDATSGARRFNYVLPPASDSPPQQWAYVGYSEGVLVGSAAVVGARRLTLSPDSWSQGYADQSPVGCSRTLFAYDPGGPSLRWRYVPQQALIVDSTIALVGGQALFVEGRPNGSQLPGETRVSFREATAGGATLVALELSTGRVAWKRNIDLSAVQTCPFLAVSGETILFSGAKNVGRRVEYELRAFRRGDGEPLWSGSFATGQDIGGGHGEQNQHPVISGDRVVFKKFACSLTSGRPVADWRLPDGGCGTLSASRGDCFFRCSGPAVADLSTGEFHMLSNVTRPGCWINIIPAGGLVLIPEASSGCTCLHYPMQTSLALRPVNCLAPEIAPVVAQRLSAARSANECRFAGSVRVEISHADPAAVIHYTLDGSWPTHASPVYAGPFDRDRATTVRAIAELPSGRQSLVSQRQFTPVEGPRLLSPSAKFVTRMKIELERLDGAARLRYSLDGSPPTPASPLYEAPIEIASNVELTAAYFLEDRLSGKVLTQRFETVPGLPPVAARDLAPGIPCAHYEGANWQRLPDFEKLVPVRVAMAGDFSLPSHSANFYALRFQGFLKAPFGGIYRFALRSDDGSRLRIDGRLVIDNDGLHDARRERRGEIALAQGMHAIHVEYFNGGLQDILSVYYEGPGIPRQLVPSTALFHSTTQEKP